MTDSILAEPSVLATFILPIAQALRLNGLDAMEVIEAAGIDPAVIVNTDRRIPMSQLQALFRACVEESGEESFGLLAAEQLQPQILQGLGLAWLAGESIYAGLKRTVRFGKVMSTGVDWSLAEEGDLVHLIMTRTLLTQEPEYAAQDFAVGMIVRMCRLTLGEFIAPVSCELERPMPADPERYEYMLASRVSFDHELTRLTFSLADVLEPLAAGDPALAKINDEQVESYLASFLAYTTSREVVSKIVEKLADGPPNQQQIAESLSVSNRTLQRKLKDEGTSFVDLLQDTRLQLARKYLRQPRRSVLEIAYLLGFSEPSTFSRAFKRWTGVAPAEYRGKSED